jgi:hypothetical protein
MILTDQAGVGSNTSDFYLEMFGSKLSWNTEHPDRSFSKFSQPLQINGGKLPPIIT